MEKFWDGKKVLITGGTGTFGTAFCEYLLQNYPNIGSITIFSRDEYKQYELRQNLLTQKEKQNRSTIINFELGDIRDFNRVLQITEDIDYILHAAALKHVPFGEIYPQEFINTNIGGAENLIKATHFHKNSKLLCLSTSKAVAPLNLYGATKLCADKLFLSQNDKNFEKTKEYLNCQYSIIRLGNLFNSRGSVVPTFFRQINSQQALTVTSLEMTRFSITLSEASQIVDLAFQNMSGGEIFIPKCPSYKINDLVQAISPAAKVEIIGLRWGEKINEELIPEADAPFTFDFDSYYITYTPAKLKFIMETKLNVYRSVNNNFSYISNHNPNFLSIKDLAKILEQLR